MAKKAETKAKAKQVRKSKTKTKTSVSVVKPKKKTPAKRKAAYFGRPLKFSSVEELQDRIEEYFKSLWEVKLDMFGNPLNDKINKGYLFHKTKVATVTGLAVFLDTTRETLLDYEKGKHDGKSETLTKDQQLENKQIDDFSDTIKRAKLMIYEDTEQQLFKGKPIGAIFSLKNNYGWKDKKEVENFDLTPPPPLSPRKAARQVRDE